jgi:carboxymethylenebutenolidase
MSMRDLAIPMPQGTCSARLFGADLPAGRAGIILYMDAFGPRPALDQMAARLAASGYFVLVPDLFYRMGAYGPFDAKTAFDDETKRAQLRGMIGSTSQAMTASDTDAFLAALTAAGATGPIGTVGYCMGGARALTAAAHYPQRIRAAASFHGGNLASDAPDSPHLLAERIEARVYVGCAGVDASFPPEQSARLAQALREAGIDHMLENYIGCGHGWAVPDSRVHDPKGAERHWKRLLDFMAESLVPDDPA